MDDAAPLGTEGTAVIWMFGSLIFERELGIGW